IRSRRAVEPPGSRTVRQCPRARRHTARRHAASRSPGGGESGDGDGSGGDGSAALLESSRSPYTVFVLLDIPRPTAAAPDIVPTASLTATANTIRFAPRQGSR